MQILHFDWLRYYRSISNSHRVVKFAGFVNLFILFYSQINTFSAEFIIAFFCPTSWVILRVSFFNHNSGIRMPGAE